MNLRNYLPYLLISAFHLVSITTYPHFANWSKALLIPLLAFGFFRGDNKVLSHYNFRFILGALFFSWVGDILLTGADKTVFFLAGIGSFFLAQACYILFFYLQPSPGMGPIRKSAAYLFLFLLYWLSMLFYLWPNMDIAFRLPVAAYSAVLVSMGIFALTYTSKAGKRPWNAILIAGAIFFILSDSIIAIDRFSSVAIWQSHLIIMLTYTLAQGMIIIGVDGMIQSSKWPFSAVTSRKQSGEEPLI